MQERAFALGNNGKDAVSLHAHACSPFLWSKLKLDHIFSCFSIIAVTDTCPIHFCVAVVVGAAAEVAAEVR